MESNGLYKAMGELDVFFNYIETYLASKQRLWAEKTVSCPAMTLFVKQSNPSHTFYIVFALGIIAKSGKNG